MNGKESHPQTPVTRNPADTRNADIIETWFDATQKPTLSKIVEQQSRGIRDSEPADSGVPVITNPHTIINREVDRVFESITNPPTGTNGK